MKMGSNIVLWAVVPVNVHPLKSIVFATGRQIIFYHYGKDPDKEIHVFLNLDLDHGLFVIVSHRVSQIELLHYGKHGLVFCKRFV